MHETLARLQALEAAAETAYAAMYDAPAGAAAAGRYSEAKEALTDAIGLARKLGETATEARLRARLAEIKTIFRTQFPA